MSATTATNQNATQEQAPPKKTAQRPLNGTESNEPKEDKSVWATLAETIAGDNKMVAGILKFVLSPFGLLLFLAGIGFLVYKNLDYKKQINVLEERIKSIKEEKEELKENLAGVKAKLIKAKQQRSLDYAGQMQGIDYIPAQQALLQKPSRNKLLFD